MAALSLPYFRLNEAEQFSFYRIPKLLITDAVLRHYERYIAALATRTLYDENGVPHLCVDEEMKRRLETKMITKILDFKLDKAA